MQMNDSSVGGIKQEAYDDIVFGLVICGWPNANPILLEWCEVRRVYGLEWYDEILRPSTSTISEPVKICL